MSLPGPEQLGDHRESLRLLARAKLPAPQAVKSNKENAVSKKDRKTDSTLDIDNNHEGKRLKRAKYEDKLAELLVAISCGHSRP